MKVVSDAPYQHEAQEYAHAAFPVIGATRASAAAGLLANGHGGAPVIVIDVLRRRAEQSGGAREDGSIFCKSNEGELSAT